MFVSKQPVIEVTDQCTVKVHPFYLIKRRVGAKRIYYVVYDDDPSQRKSTGIEATPENREAAVAWAYAHQRDIYAQRITLRELTVDMFTDRCRWRARVTSKGRTFGPEYWMQHRGRLDNWILPRFGSFPPDDIKPPMIDDWLLEIKVAKATKDKIIQTFRRVYDELVYRSYATTNPARSVSYYSDSEQKRQPITLEDFHALFPEDEEELIRIWGGLKWATFFYIMATTGMRPGELTAFDLDNYIPGVGYACATATEHKTREVKGLKTSKKGVAVKPVYLTTRAEQLIAKYRLKIPPQRRLLFAGATQIPHPSQTTNKAFRAALRRSSRGNRNLTQYSLRHFFSTMIATVLSEEEAALYLGQTKYRDDYDHRKAVDHLRADHRMKSVAETLFRRSEPPVDPQD